LKVEQSKNNLFENYTLLGDYAASTGNFLLTFRETSVRNYHYSMLTTQKSAFLIHFAEETLYHGLFGLLDTEEGGRTKRR